MPSCYYYDWHRNRCNCYVNENLNELLAENAKLRDELELWHRLTAGIELPEYPITEFQPKDLERENVKLRELAAELYQCSRQYGCDRCGYKDGCAMFDRMAQLGIEVSE